jgi:hypothetical protein
MVPRRQGRFEHVYSRGHGRGDISPLLATTVYTVSRLGAGSQQLACSKAPKAKSVLLSEVLHRFTGDVWMQTLTNCENAAALLSWFTGKWRGKAWIEYRCRRQVSSCSSLTALALHTSSCKIAIAVPLELLTCARKCYQMKGSRRSW